MKLVQLGMTQSTEICESFKPESIVAATRVNLILKSQEKRVWSVLNWLKANHSKFNLQISQLSSKELDKKEFHAQIKKVAKNELSKPLNSSELAQKTEQFYQLYILSRSIQYGSFGQYWQKIESGRDQPETYFSTERKLGMRYFKKKIEEAISKV